MIDLIDECGQDLSSCGYETVEFDRYKASCSKLFVESPAKAKKLGFDYGHYFIFNAPLLSSFMSEHEDLLIAEISYRLAYLLKQNKIKKRDRILFVGIGNPKIMADSFGVKVVEKIEIMPMKKNNRLFKIIPNTFLNTGINAYEFIRMIVEAFDISAVFLFDSLATTNLTRLGSSVQFNDAGLTPGSAVSNFGQPINKRTLSVPCICFGVPMMISTKSLGAKQDIILTEKDVEERVEFLSSVVAKVVEACVK